MWFSVVCTLIKNDRFLPQYQLIKEMGFISDRELKKALRDTLMPPALSGLYPTWKISQSDCEISSNCGKISDLSKG